MKIRLRFPRLIQVALIHCCLVFTLPTSAQTLLLIHGMNADETIWFQSGVIPALRLDGWQYQGNLSPSDVNTPMPQAAPLSNKKQIYTLRLPWFRPIAEQSSLLTALIHRLNTIHQEPVTLIGHSLGGVIGRHTLIDAQTHPFPIQVDHLITIASPHLGSPWAWFMWQALQTPAKSLLIPLQAQGFSQADTLLFEIASFPQNNLIHQMTKRPHPDIRYTSIIHRMSAPTQIGDFWVSPDSQNMNSVLSLQGRSKILAYPAEHNLTLQDAWALRQLLRHNPLHSVKTPAN